MLYNVFSKIKYKKQEIFVWVCAVWSFFNTKQQPKYNQIIDLTSLPLVPAPCAVQNTLSTLNCGTNSLSISWVPGSIPMNYSATAVTANNTSLQCNTRDSSCTISGLQCGQQYTVRVKPVSSTCEGQSSAPEIVNSGVLSVQPTVTEKKNHVFLNLY